MARRRGRSSSRGRRRGKRGKFPWLLAGAAAVGAFFLFGGTASAAPHPGADQPPPTPGPNPVPVPTPVTSGWKAGRYQVTTNDTGPTGDLMLREKADGTSAVLERLPHGSFVQASNLIQNGWAAVMSPSGISGWCFAAYLTYAP